MKASDRISRLTREVRDLVHDLTVTRRELAEERARKPLRIPYRGEVS